MQKRISLGSRAAGRPALLLLTCLLCFGAQAQSGFVVRDIRIEGLQRITDGAVFNYLPINIGDTMTPSRLQETLRAVYGSGFFVDAELRRQGDTLIIAVRERPAINRFEIDGNKDIKTEDLEENLRGVGLAPGLSFDQSVLDDVRGFLTQEYFDRGKYGATVETRITELPDNRVDVFIDIFEGDRAEIKQINIVGNTVFPDEELLEEMSLRTRNWLSWWRKDDRYSKEALVGDQEAIQSYYMDRGYASFQLESTQVAISPDKKDVYITLNLSEGPTFTVSDVKLSGDLVVSERELTNLVLIKPGQTFSRKLLTQTNELISYRLGSEGFAQAEVQPIPEIDEEARTVALDLRVVPGARMYVRDIKFSGTANINDDVFRREMRQMESAWLSNTALERSKQRIRRLAFVEEVEFETRPVPGTNDMVDVEFDIKEGLPGQFGGGLGYSQTYGLTLNGNFIHSNFLGTGNRVAVDINAGDFSKIYSLSYTDPYLTPDGVSRTLGASYRDTTQFSSASSSFTSEILNASVEYGFPLSEYSALRLGVILSDSSLEASAFSSDQALEWVNNNGSPYDVTNQSMADVCGMVEPGESLLDVCGTDFNAYELFAGWVYDSRDRVIFPRRGLRQRLSLTVTSPGSDIEYYVAEYNLAGLWPVPFFNRLIAGVNLEIGYGEDLGSTTTLPPYKRFFSGGPDSVRGFRQSRLGPIDSRGNSFGGNLKTVAQFSLILPTPEKFANSMRLSLFYDVGNVFDTGSTTYRARDLIPNDDIAAPFLDYKFDVKELRQSAGVAVEWLAPLGTFRFSYAYPFDVQEDAVGQNGAWLIEGDDIERFQFSIGRSF